ncbi:lactonase family protein [Aquibacillus salsiterrae]|uniref:Lactonase family protein n=1 Tax=Aquibacillus salsiterrae TaxID=2950439 RepID=A0A9X3WFB7_9BACI|nr:lactonase family protein [Aquibacillus salsiterrae]MDC3417958.1 lactonase family protein [Aquibacillus salsiterrae]
MANNIIGYVGTYTKEASQGVYSFKLDKEKGQITDVKLTAKLNNPTYLTVSKDNQFLYAVAKEGDKGGVTAFSIDDENGELALLNSEASEGAPPCHVSVKSDNSTVLTANYHTTKVESYVTNEDGSVVLADVAKHNGNGPHERQEKPHMHFAGFSPDEKYAIAIDLGSDTISTYTVDNGKLSLANEFVTKPGSGPRHLAFHPNGKVAYVMTELSSEVLVLEFNEANGSFQQVQAIAAIPTDFDGVNDGSAIHISPDGKFVYAGNRGHNSIAIFSVSEESNITFVDWTLTEGNWPRDFAIDPSGEFLIAANQKSNTLVLFSRDKETGKLSLLQKDVYAPEAVCVKFLNQ